MYPIFSDITVTCLVRLLFPYASPFAPNYNLSISPVRKTALNLEWIAMEDSSGSHVGFG